MSREATTKMEMVLTVLVVISIIISASTLYYVSSVVGQLSSQITESTKTLTKGMEGLSASLAEIAKIVGAPPAKVFTCPTCGGVFPSEEALKKHIETIHPSLPIAAVLGVDPTTLDPHQIYSTPEAIVTEHLYDKLVTIDKNGDIIPELATSWEVSKDNLEYVFHLRKGVKFHDGTPLNASAVVYSIQRFIRKLPPEEDIPRMPLITYVIMIDHAEVIDEYTVKIVLKYPHTPFLSRIGSSCCGIISPTAAKKWGPKDFGEYAIGSGPYKLVEWRHGYRVVLERNEEYWGGLSPTKRIVFTIVTEAATRVTMLEAGDADLIVSPPMTDVPRLEKNPKFVVIKFPSTRVIYIGMNTQWGPLKDKRVRQALNYAVDKAAIVEKILGGLGVVMDSPLTREMFGHYSVGTYAYDPAKAKKLLEEAGYPNGFKATFYHPTGRYFMDVKIAEAVQSYLMAVGVSCELKTMDWPSYMALISKPLAESPLQLFVLGWGPWILDGDQMLYPMFHSEQWPPKGMASTFYNNSRADALIIQGTRILDPTERLKIYREAQEIIMDDAPWLFLHNERYTVVYTEKLRNVIMYPIEQFDLISASKST